MLGFDNLHASYNRLKKTTTPELMTNLNFNSADNNEAFLINKGRAWKLICNKDMFIYHTQLSNLTEDEWNFCLTTELIRCGIATSTKTQIILPQLNTTSQGHKAHFLKNRFWKKSFLTLATTSIIGAAYATYQQSSVWAIGLGVMASGSMLASYAYHTKTKSYMDKLQQCKLEKRNYINESAIKWLTTIGQATAKQDAISCLEKRNNILESSNKKPINFYGMNIIHINKDELKRLQEL